MAIEVNGLLLTARQAARELAISERTLWGLTARGEIPCVRIGRAVRYSRSDLVAWIAAKSGTPSMTVANPDI